MNKQRGRIGDEAIKKATGRTPEKWFDILNKAGGKKMTHTDIARFLSTHYIKSGWWAQMVTVEYEREQGRRKVNENADGFIVGVHKTVHMPLKQLEKEWNDLASSHLVAQKHLMPIPTKSKRRMLRYKADVGSLVVYFDDRGEGKSRIMVESVRLPSQKMVEENRTFWKKVLSNIG
jgi:hypothetical protein